MRKRSTGFLSTSVICFLMTLTIVGCDKTIFPDPPLKSKEMEATISGFGTFIASNAQTVNGSLTYSIHSSIQGEDSQDTLVFDIVVTKKSTVPYTIDFSDANSSMNYCVANSNGSCTNYRVSQSSGSGTLTITSISPNVEGTFSGTFKSLTGPQTVSITNGAFNSPF